MSEPSTPRWRPLSAIDRRVAGVLIEKAKTTPDQYPMSLNALRSGCNQKNNREPLMELSLDDIEESLTRLREAGAVGEVIGGGRVSRFRHYLYEWLGVDKVELAVMAELLLRGAQTEGDLRGRAARMEPIADVAALRPVLDSLRAKGLVIPLTPEGRGHVLTHALFEPRELERLKSDYRNQLGSEVSSARSYDSPRPVSPAVTSATPRPPAAAPPDGQAIERLQQDLGSLRAEVADLRQALEELSSQFRSAIGSL